MSREPPESALGSRAAGSNTLDLAGVKGIGELGDVGINAAVANAVFHATGVRV
jgi:CO/xanthine dehydrogenase Mo-binding subunit